MSYTHFTGTTKWPTGLRRQPKPWIPSAPADRATPVRNAPRMTRTRVRATKDKESKIKESTPTATNRGPYWEGPYEVLGHAGPDMYTLKVLADKGT